MLNGVVKVLTGIMSKQIGGRGKKAPYESTHVRIPLPIKDRVEELKNLYINDQLEHHDYLTAEDHRLAGEYKKLLAESNGRVQCRDNPLTGIDEKIDCRDNPLTGIDDALELARKLLKQKKSAKDTVAKLLTGIYAREISVDELKF
jgi:hypothetical protein